MKIYFPQIATFVKSMGRNTPIVLTRIAGIVLDGKPI